MNRKKSQTMDRKSHNLIRYDKLNKLKELGFTTSWNINLQKKDYNALEDPHADRYFRYQSVKMHIKQFRKSLNKVEKNHIEKKKIAKLIKQKLSDHLPAIKVAAQTYNIPNSQLNKSQMTQNILKQKSFKGLNKQKSLTMFAKNNKNSKSKRKKHDTSNSNYADISLEPIAQFSGNDKDQSVNSKQDCGDGKIHTQNNLVQRSQKSLRIESKRDTQRNEYLKKQQQLLHKKKHEEFIQFIAKKRETLQLGKK